MTGVCTKERKKRSFRLHAHVQYCTRDVQILSAILFICLLLSSACHWHLNRMKYATHSHTGHILVCNFLIPSNKRKKKQKQDAPWGGRTLAYPIINPVWVWPTRNKRKRNKGKFEINESKVTPALSNRKHLLFRASGGEGDCSHLSSSGHPGRALVFFCRIGVLLCSVVPWWSLSSL